MGIHECAGNRRETVAVRLIIEPIDINDASHANADAENLFGDLVEVGEFRASAGENDALVKTIK